MTVGRSATATLLHGPLDAAAALADFTARAADQDAGAVVSFTGLARGQGADGAVGALVLHHYRGVTLASLQAIADDALARFDVGAVDVRHRSGMLLPGQPIVFAAAAARHRRQAFLAADYLMDRLKTDAVFWKQEQGPDGARWIEPRDADHDDRARWDLP